MSDLSDVSDDAAFGPADPDPAWFDGVEPAIAPSGPTPIAPPPDIEAAPERGPGRLRQALTAERLLLGALAVLAVVPFDSMFFDQMFLVYSIGAVIVVGLVSGILSPRRPFAVALWVAVAALFAYLAIVVFEGAAGSVYGDLTTAGQTLMSTSPSFVNEARFLVGPVALAAFAAFISFELAARTRLVALTTLPPLLAFGVALVYTGQRPQAYGILPVTLVALAVLGVVLVRGNRTPAADTEVTAMAEMRHAGAASRGAPSYRRMGVPVLAVVVAGALVLGLVLPVVKDSLRVDLNQRYDPEVDVAGEISPLASVKEGINDPANPVMFTVRFDGVAPDRAPDRIRIAALEDYDGAVWSTGAKFPKIGPEAPPPLQPVPRPTTEITQTVRLQGAYRSSFLPELDRPTGIRSNAEIGFDRSSGVLVTDAPRDRVEYTVRSKVPVDDEARFRAAAPGVDPAMIGLAEPPPGVNRPEAITAYANQTTFDKATTYDTLKAIEADMKSDGFGYDPKATSGSAYAVLARFLAADPDEVTDGPSRIGYSEQFAAAFALVARLRRLPSRVVVGYLITKPADAVGRDYEVRANDIHAWTEVHLNGVGWVRFDGTNRQPRRAEPPPPSDQAPSPTGPPTTQPVPVTTADVTPQIDGCSPDPAACTDEGGIGGVILAAFLSLLLLLLLVGLIVLPVAVVAAKWLRRRRRFRHGTTAQRIVGAWREVLDRLRVHGVPTRSSMTATEVSDSLSGTVEGEAAARIAEFTPLLDQALYSPDTPAEDLVTAAWKAEAGVADVVREQHGLGSRLRARFDPRPLVGSTR